MQTNEIILMLLLLAGMVGSFVAGKLTIPAAITGGVTAFLLYMGCGWTGVVLMTAFFLLGTCATSWKSELKQTIGAAEKNKGRRNAGQVLANSGMAAMVSVIAFCFPQHGEVMMLMAASAFSSATADTLSSELGSIYGQRFYNIIDFRKDQRGLDGVVSLEGLIFGLIGSTIIAILFGVFHGWHIQLLWIIIAGTLGNLADSVLGATLERRGVIKNNTVNFLNTLIAALAGLILYFLVSKY